MNYLERHIEHTSGMYSLFSWLLEQENKGYSHFIHNQTVYLNQNLSKYFGIGVGKNKKKKTELFFACQPIESEWLSLIKWKKISLNIEKQILFLVSDVVKGDEQSIPDIPSFILAIYVDTEEKMNLISSKKELSCREYFIDEYDNIQVNFHKLIFQIPVEAALNIEQNNQELFDYAKMIHQKEQQSEIYSNKPNFIGDIAQIEGTDSILKKWKENKV
jgi:hypothetical protein